MMGLSNGVHWVAWFINSFVVMFLSIILMLIVLKVWRKNARLCCSLSKLVSVDFLCRVNIKGVADRKEIIGS